MTISVIIPAYNEEKYLAACLDSLMQQTITPKEIIVVDNNSTDRTKQVAQHYPITVVIETKQGITPARNHGFDVARGEILARCDADCILPKNWLQLIHHYFSTKNIDALTGPISFYDLPLKSPVISYYYMRITQLLQGSTTLVGPNMAIKKTMWQKVRQKICIDDRLVHEDIDLAFHINKEGGSIYLAPDLIINVSGRRIKKRPTSFFLEYPVRYYRTLRSHRP